MCHRIRICLSYYNRIGFPRTSTSIRMSPKFRFKNGPLELESVMEDLQLERNLLIAFAKRSLPSGYIQSVIHRQLGRESWSSLPKWIWAWINRFIIFCRPCICNTVGAITIRQNRKTVYFVWDIHCIYDFLSWMHLFEKAGSDLCDDVFNWHGTSK